jgi:hypothetical protein
MRPALGSLIGAVGGLVFVLVNVAGLPAGWVWPLRLLGLVAFAAVVVVALRAWSGQPGDPPAPDALRPYLVSVAAMAVAVPLGSIALRRLVDRPELTLPWVVLVVGAHFLPMARAFRAPVFRALGLGLVLVALVGGVLTLLDGTGWASATGVAAGFALLAAAASGVVRRRQPVR